MIERGTRMASGPRAQPCLTEILARVVEKDASELKSELSVKRGLLCSVAAVAALNIFLLYSSNTP